VIRVPLPYNPETQPQRIPKFFKEVIGEENVPLIDELFGFCLDSNYSIHRAFLFVGDGANGKSTMVELLRHFLGKDNCATVPLQAFDSNRFASSQLWGKLANLYADLPTTSIQHTGRFKMLTGGDTVSGEEKYRSQFSFNNRAKLVFSANRPPRIQNEDSFAFWRRWIIVNCPNEFTQGRADKNLLDKLSGAEEIAGVLNLALAGLKRLWQNGDFTYLPSVDDVTEQYLRGSSPMHAFLADCCILGPDNWTSKDDLYERFKLFCIENKLPVLGKETFGRAMMNCPEASSVRSERHRINGILTHGWKGVMLCPPTGGEGLEGGGDTVELSDGPAEPGDDGPPSDISF
jgi:putative DNA primase/helicase